MATRLECALLEGDALATWDALVDRVPSGTIFHSHRWTEIIAGAFDRRARILGVFRNGVLIGGAPLYERRAAGLSIANPPVVAGYAGALVDLPEYERASRSISEAEQILGALEAGVRERFGYARLTHPPSIVDARPFLWSGWRVSPRFTYRIAPRNPDDIFAALEHNARKKIRRAEDAGLAVQPVSRTEEMISAYEASYRRHDTPAPVPLARIGALADRLLAAGLARGFVVRGTDGAVHAFKLQVFDRRASYAWIAGSVPEHIAEGGFSLMTWRILCDAAASNLAYDFLGANTPTIARFKRAFGGDLVHYWETTYETRVARALFALRGLVRG